MSLFELKEQVELKKVDASIFDGFWLSGPWQKHGKKQAERHFKASVKTDQDLRDICTARDRYAAHLKAASFPLTPQYGSTWFNNWREWINPDVPIRRTGTVEPLVLNVVPTGCKGHQCNLCNEPHTFKFADCDPEVNCGITYEVACPEFAMRFRR